MRRRAKIWGLRARQGHIWGPKFIRLRRGGGPLRWEQKFPPESIAMPKLPDMSAAAVKSREALTKIYKASKAKEVAPAPPKPRTAKRR